MIASAGLLSSALGRKQLEALLTKHGGIGLAEIGCRSRGEFYGCCEHDLAVVGDSYHPTKRLQTGDVSVDLHFAKLDQLTPEMELALASAHIVCDPNWSTGEIFQRFKRTNVQVGRLVASSKLIDALAKLTIAQFSLERSRPSDANLWVEEAGYKMAEALLAKLGETMGPSHLLQQLQARTFAVSAGAYAAFSSVERLHRATATACSRRLDALQIALFSVGDTMLPEEADYYWASPLHYPMVEERFRVMLSRHDLVAAYASLGLLLARTLILQYRILCGRMGVPEAHELILDELFEERESPLYGKRSIVKLMDLSEDPNLVSAMAGQLRNAINEQKRLLYKS